MRTPVLPVRLSRAVVPRSATALAGLALAAVAVAVGLAPPAAPPAEAGPVLAPNSVAPLFADDFEDGNAAGWTSSGGQWSVGGDGAQVYRQRGTSANARTVAGDGTWTNYSMAAAVKPTTLRGMRLAVDGAALTGSVGTTTISATDSQFGAGRIGLATGYATGSFDSVLVEPPAPAAPDTQRPSVPGQPQVLAVTPTTATITWAPASDNVGVVSYLVFQGDQFYTQWLSRTVPNNDPLTLPLSPTGASLHFSVAARDAAGNTSTQSARAYLTQPPSYPRTGDETVPPTAPGAPVATGYVPGGGVILSWTPATDNVGVVEYHVYHTFYVDEVRVEAKVPTNTAVITPRGGSYETVRVVAYDAAWNSSSSPSVRLGLPPTPPATPPIAGR